MCFVLSIILRSHPDEPAIDALAAVIASVVSTQVRVAEGIAIGSERSQLRIVTRGIMEGARTSWAVRDTLLYIARTIRTARIESVMICKLKKWRKLRSRRWWGRRCIARSAPEPCKKQEGRCCNENKTCGFHILLLAVGNDSLG